MSDTVNAYLAVSQPLYAMLVNSHNAQCWEDCVESLRIIGFAPGEPRFEPVVLRWGCVDLIRHVMNSDDSRRYTIVTDDSLDSIPTHIKHEAKAAWKDRLKFNKYRAKLSVSAKRYARERRLLADKAMQRLDGKQSYGVMGGHVVGGHRTSLHLCISDDDGGVTLCRGTAWEGKKPTVQLAAVAAKPPKDGAWESMCDRCMLNASAGSMLKQLGIAQLGIRAKDNSFRWYAIREKTCPTQ